MFEANWYAGNFFLDFRGASPVVTCPATIDAFEGSSTWSHPTTGELQYFTNGISVRNAAGDEIISDAGGDPTATETGVFIPVPGSTDEMFVFANDTTSVFATRISTTNDSVLATTAQVATGTGEAIGGIEDGTLGFWLVLFNGNKLDARHIVNATVVGVTPVQSDLPLTVTAASRGTIRFNRAGTRIAIATETPAGSWWADFDRATGLVTSAWTQVHTAQGYSLEFSPDGNTLYVPFSSSGSVAWSADRIRQYDLATASHLDLEVAASGIALGFDDRLYFAPYNVATLSAINNPNVGGLENVVTNAVDLGACRVKFNLSKTIFVPLLSDVVISKPAPSN